MAGYAAALAALSDEDLTGLLRRRPDLLAGGGPRSFPELASRAAAPASLAAALATLDATSLQLAELLAVVGLPTTVAEVRAAAGPDLAEADLTRALERLAELGIALPQADGTLAGPGGLGAPFGTPGGLNPSVADLARVGVSAQHLETIAGYLGIERPARKADLVRAVAAGLADPEAVARLLKDADGEARGLLDRALATPGPLTVHGVGYGRFAGYPDARPAAWLLDRGLLLPVTYNQLVVPREVQLALRGGLVFPAWPRRPAPPARHPLPDAPARAAAAAQRLTVAAEGLVRQLDEQPLPLIQAGTVALRDLRRLARELELAEDEAGLLVDLCAAAGLLGTGGPWEQRTLALRPEADGWLQHPRARRWADLAVAWRDTDLALEGHLLERHGLRPRGADRARPLSGRRQPAWPARRRSLLDLLVRLAGGQAVDAAALASTASWHLPMTWGGQREGLARVVLDAAAFLGLVVGGGTAAPAPTAAAWLSGASAAELAEAAAPLLPDGPTRFLVAGDLTVVAPPGLDPAVQARLSLLARRLPGAGGGATTWRIDEATFRAALDRGLTAEGALGFLREHSETPLPQALEYLAGDVARRHGRLRVGAATTYLRGDPAAVAAFVRSAAGRRLALQELAPGVAVTACSQQDLLAALRGAGEAPVAEEPDGTPQAAARQRVRHAGRPLTGRAAAASQPAAAPPADPAALVARLRRSLPPIPDRAGGSGPGHGAATASRDATATTPAEVAAVCQRAAEEATAVEIGYRDRSGEEGVHTIEPIRVRAGRVQAWCRLRKAERTFDLAGVLWARPEPASHA